MPRLDVGNPQRPARDRAQADKAAHLHIVRPDRHLRPMQPLLAMHNQRVAADPLDRATHRRQQPAKLLHMRLAGRVAQDRGPAGQRGGHNRILRRGHRSLVQQNICAAQPAARAQFKRAAAGPGERSPQMVKGEQMRVDPPPPDVVAACRAADLERAPPRQQRPHQVQSPADTAEKPCIRRMPVQSLRTQPQPAALPADRDPQPCQDFQHRTNVVDLRHIFQDNGFIGEQRSGNQGKCGVLVAADADSSFDWMAALDGK